jgi:site-specific recombinase XerC
MLFDWLVTGQVVATNPAHAVRGPKHVVKTGKTTVLTGEQARELLKAWKMQPRNGWPRKPSSPTSSTTRTQNC